MTTNRLTLNSNESFIAVQIMGSMKFKPFLDSNKLCWKASITDITEPINFSRSALIDEKAKCPLWGSNSRPSDYETDALTNCAKKAWN